MRKYSARSIVFAVAGVSVLLTTLGCFPDVEARQATPEGFEKYMVFMASGVLDATNRDPQPGVTGCNPLFCNGEYFQREIMGRSEEEIEEFTEDAKSFFIERFGIDVDAEEMADRVVFNLFMTNPDWGYRMFTLSGARVPEEGWVVRDGGYVLQVTDPDGIDLGGEFAGTHAPAGSVMFYGNYNILVEKRGRQKEIVMLFKSGVPGRIAGDGSVSLRCELEHETWGAGFATVTVANVPLEHDFIQGVGRNVLTFPPFPGDALEYEGVVEEDDDDGEED